MFIIIFSFISLAVADHCLKDPSVQRIYEVINELQKHRHRRYQSQIQQLYDEQVWEIYEEDLENQIRRNRIEIERTQLMIEKYFLQRRACIEKLLDFLQSVDQGFNANSNETESLNTYFYSVEQFIFAQSCYEVIQQNTEIDIELMSKEELEKFEIFQQYYDNYNLGQDRLKTKLSVETATIDFRLKWDSFQEVFADDPERLQEMLAKLFWNSRQAYGRLKDTLQAEYEQAINAHQMQKRKVDTAREKEMFLKQQIQYNQEVLQMETLQHYQLREMLDKDLRLLHEQFDEIYRKLQPECQSDAMGVLNVTDFDMMKYSDEDDYKKPTFKYIIGKKSEGDL